MKKNILALLLSLIFAPSHSQLQPALQQIMDEHQLMGFSVVTLCGGQIDEVVHGGKKDFTRDLYIDDSTMYRIASISKLVTATGLMNLYEDGLFGLDDDISEAMGVEIRNPSFAEIPITYRMLLSHTSSLQDGNGYDDLLGDTYNNGPNAPDIIEYLLEGGDYFASNNWRTEEPGTYFVYSNFNFGLIATLIEKLSGMRFDQYMKEFVLDPLDIAGSYNIGDINNIDQVAVIYRNVNNAWVPQADNYQGVPPVSQNFSGYIPGTNGLIFGPQGGLRISALDLAKILLVHSNLNPGVLEPTTIALMSEPQWTYDGSNGDNYYGLFRSWGLGMHITTNAPMGDIVFDGETMMGHPGEAYGLISDFYFGSQNGSGFIFIANGAFEGYEFGDSSAFYSVEEDVFEAIYSQSIFVCVSSTDKIDPVHLELFPNPATSLLFIRSVSAVTPKTVVIRDLAGRLLWEQTIQSGQIIQVEISPWPAGIYSVDVHYNHILYHGRFEKVN